MCGGIYACEAPTWIESDAFDIGLSVVLKHERVVLKKKNSLAPNILCIYMCVLYIYINIYIYIERETETETDRQTDREEEKRRERESCIHYT